MNTSDRVRIVVATFGVSAWAAKAKNAMISAIDQTVPCEVVHVHGRTLAAARNAGAAPSGCEWCVFVDADDELDRGYVEAMLQGEGDLRQPATLGVYPDGSEDECPVVIPPRRSILDGNWLVIGTMIRYDLFHRACGFRELDAFEDWDLYVRCIQEYGATVGVVPDAIYRVGVNPDSRNHMKPVDAGRLVRQITGAYR